jgi:hypothetical protein
MLHNAQVVGFAEGTPVLMADGKWKPIEEVKQGDWVMSFNPAIENSELEPRKVVNTFSTLHRDCIEIHANGKVTIVAKDQLFFTPGANWSAGYDTKQVMNFAGDRQEIQVRRVRGGKFKVFDITVDETHALVANDLRVHNGGSSNNKKKKVIVQAPQPVVTAGKPGKPVSVTTIYNGNTTTVVVNPSPGSSGQISVGASGTIGVRQTGVPGLPVSDGTYYQPIAVLPYPGGSYVRDRALNAEIIRSSVCGNMLNRGTNHKATSSEVSSWKSELNSLISELESMKNVNIHGGPTRIAMSVDPTLINDAISNARSLSNSLKAGRKLTIGLIRQNCDKLANIIGRIQSSVPSDSVVLVPQPIPMPLPPRPIAPPVVVCPNPSSYYSERIYEGQANYEYMTALDNCQYVFDPPNAPANTSVRYFRHFDPNSGRYYYDRINSRAVCAGQL